MAEPYGAPPPPRPPRPPLPPPPYVSGGALDSTPRPSAWWWAVGPGLIVASVVVFVVLIIGAFGSITHTFRGSTDVVVDGRPHDVRVTGSERGYLWLGAGDENPTCRIVDTSTGEQIPLRPMSGETISSSVGGTYDVIATFDVGSGKLMVTCASPAAHPYTSVLVGPDPHLARSVALVLVAIFAPGIVGLAGIVVLIVTAVLWSRRAPRPRNLSATE